ncbi:MAG: hypothetical protein ABFQ89_05525 [Chloroflexota bacterium]
MSEKISFEQAWLKKLSDSLDTAAGTDVRREIMAGSETLSDVTDRTTVIRWSREAMIKLEEMLDPETAQVVMTGCACQYPQSALENARQLYRDTGDLAQVHRQLQDQFESFLRNDLKLDESLLEQVVQRGWGLAGVLQKDRIIATKIPKSGFLKEYLEEVDPEKRREIYCHCPRIRDAIKLQEDLPAIYCYCGAGFYQGIWEYILDQPVKVELLASVLQGDDHCTVAIHLPTSPLA